MSSPFPILALCSLLGCAAEPAPELVIDRADATGIAGSYGAIHFDSRAVQHDGAPGVAAAFFDERGVRLAAQYPGKSPPADWSAAAGPGRNPDHDALVGLPDAAAALLAAQLPATNQAEREALIELGSPATGAAAPSEQGAAHGRCDHYVERMATSYTHYPCWEALSYLQGHYAECSAWIRTSWLLRDYEYDYTEYFCLAAAIY